MNQLIEANPMTIIEKAIERGVDADQLSKLMDLQERFVAQRRRESFNRAMCACQKAMPTVVKDAENTHNKARYARLETVSRAIKPVYTENGFSLAFGTEDSPQPNHIRIVCDVMHESGHVQRYHVDIPVDGAGSQGGRSSMNATQATGSTYQYGRRYLTTMIFNVTIALEDDDGVGQNAVIGPDEIEHINLLLEECRAIGKEVDFGRFLKFLGVESLERLTLKKYTVAIKELQRKRMGK